MDKKIAICVVLAASATFFLVATLPAQQSREPPPSAPGHAHDSMAGMDMSQHDSDKTPDASKAANDAMSDRDMDMSAHMYMTALRPANPADEKRAEDLFAQLRPAMSKNTKTIASPSPCDGCTEIFDMPDVPQPHYHFTNYASGFEAAFEFNPAHPTSLLYKKTKRWLRSRKARCYTARKLATPLTI